MTRHLHGLNPEQRRAVTTTEGPVLVLAGAGTGKTRVITVRIAHLLGKGVPPSAILAMTFTNKAAAEMRERVGGLVGGETARQLTVGTFHSFCVRLLRENADAARLPGSFTICDESDQLAAIKAVLRDLRVGEATLHPGALKSIISLQKNRLAAAAEEGDDRGHLIARARELYDERLRRGNTVDFDDLLLLAVDLLRRHRKVRDRYRERYRYLLVDEYQDTNAPQYEIVRQIAGGHRNLCVVGDDDQSIYGWRGADITKILHFERDFRGATVVRLETNYRSTRAILDAANAVIRNNPSRHEKSLRASRGEGDPVAVLQLEDEEREADHVVREILSQVERKEARLGDFAILFRTQVQPRPFEAALRARRLPYHLVGGMSFFDRKEVRDLLAFLRLLANPDDEAALLRVLNVPPRGVGATSLERVMEFATREGLPIGEAFRRGAEVARVPESALRAVADLRAALASLAAPEPGRNLVSVLRRLLEVTDYESELLRCYPDPAVRETRRAAVLEVLNLAENYVRRSGAPTLTEFVQEVTLSAEETPQEEPGRREAVTLMTLHAAKGLEFPCVFLVGCEEGLLPHEKSVQADTIEEERRLMYVGITRAQRRLTITCVKNRARHGRRREAQPSRFLLEAGLTPGRPSPPDLPASTILRRWLPPPDPCAKSVQASG